MARVPILACFLAALILCVACQESEQTALRATLKSIPEFSCLKTVHWRRVEKTGAYRWSIIGWYFDDLGKPFTRPIEMSDYRYDVVAVGQANELIRQPEMLEAAYIRAGSPRARPNQTATMFEGDDHLFKFEHKYALGFVRGKATGWLSQETHIFCGYDAPSGRIFIIETFQPAFPVRVR